MKGICDPDHPPRTVQCYIDARFVGERRQIHEDTGVGMIDPLLRGQLPVEVDPGFPPGTAGCELHHQHRVVHLSGQNGSGIRGIDEQPLGEDFSVNDHLPGAGRLPLGVDVQRAAAERC